MDNNVTSKQETVTPPLTRASLSARFLRR